ncbi:IS110 family transposase [Enterocloster clostridioformis]|uniref:Transposase IS116/IS110/IS902 family protein n=1 Tax=Enterocloster clostridioformis TaxID=1531 RepID=A0A1I0JYC2_9FIRM|nr:IS110 family transposase [Enterocloster clostridioformis]SEU15198.1 Transposase IS116/IS110/IS902 family protein [Enterocloster clostridioformis]SEW47545.1 Transposase IS116/IS110/IS902 family protein [Enterocloster clostridioformis]
MIKINYMSTLFVGIDVSSKSNVVCAMDFDENQYLTSSFSNNQPGAVELTNAISDCMRKHPDLNTIVVVLESTSVYSIHIANFLSTCEELLPYKPYVFCVNPKMTANYRKTYIGMDKTDPMDAYLIADFARVGRIKKLEPWRGAQYLALKRLTRHRLHLAECITREKTYMVSNLYLKFSELQLLDSDDQPFSNIYGATASAVITEFFSLQDIIDASEEDLLTFLAEKSRNRITDISKTSELLKKAARDSYRLDKCMYEPINISLASSFNCIQTYQKEIKLIDQAIEKCINGMHPNALTILKSIPGIGPVWAAGILSEIGDITAFHSSDALAKYAGLTWKKNDSGDFVSEDNNLTKAGNTYLRYYLGEAANSVRRFNPEYKDFYAKKYAEITKHQHKRALALTSRKLVRLVFGLLVKNQLYTGEKLDTEFNTESE